MRLIWLLSVFISFLSFSLKGQSTQPIIMDGFFEDWAAFPGFMDTEGDGEELDLIKYSLAYDHENLYLYFENSTEIDLFDGTDLKIYLNLDGLVNTGVSTNSIGAEMVLDFAKKEISWHYLPTPKTQTMSSFNMLALPTYTSKEFEIAIPILKDEYWNTLLKSEIINIQFIGKRETEDYLPNLGESIPENISKIQPPLQLDSVKNKPENSIRLLHYNTLHDGITNTERKTEFKKLVKALNPDIISFNELWETTEVQALSFLNSCFPNENWSAKKVSGNITCTKFQVDEWFVPSKGDRIIGGLFTVKLPSDTFQIYHTNMHLSCCAKDSQRKGQILANNLFVDSLKTSGTLNLNIPMLISGDMNLVGYKDQYLNLVNGNDFSNQVDYDNSPLLDVCPKALNSLKAQTWRDVKSKYPPGRLDYVFISDSNAEVVQSFVFDTETLTEKDLKKFNLNKNTTTKASDHLPLVVDFSVY